MKDVVQINLSHLTKLGLIFSLLSVAVLIYFLPNPVIILPFLVLFLISLFGFLILYPRIGFYGFVISLFVAPILLNFIPGISGFVLRELPLIVIYFLLFLIACQYGTTKIKNIKIGALEICLFILFFVMLFQAIRQSPLSVGLLGFKSIMYYSPLYFIVLIFFDTKDKIQQLMKVLIYAGIFLALVSILQHIFTQRIMNVLGFEVGDLAYRTSMGHLKASGTLGNPSAFAVVIALILFHIFLLKITGILNLKKLPATILIMLLGVGLILSFSRITFLIFIILFISLGIIYKRKMVKYYFVVLFFLFIANLVLNNFLLENFLSSFGLGKNVLGINSTAARIDILNKGLTLFAEKPIFGYGLGITDAPSRHYAEILKFGYLSTDNFYLKLLLESGIIGASLFIIFIAISISKGWKVYQNVSDPYLKTLCLSLILGIIMITMVNTANTVLELSAINCIFWIMLGLISACYIADIRLSNP